MAVRRNLKPAPAARPIDRLGTFPHDQFWKFASSPHQISRSHSQVRIGTLSMSLPLQRSSFPTYHRGGTIFGLVIGMVASGFTGSSTKRMSKFVAVTSRFAFL